jgi:hypothetical protein
MEFSPKSPIIWEQPEIYLDLDHSKDSTLDHEWEDGDTPETNIDGIAEYAVGLWFRYLTTFPKRVVKKPLWQQLVRFSSNKPTEDAANVGDRTLAIYLSAGGYHFTTYNLKGPRLSVSKDIPYRD